MNIADIIQLLTTLCAIALAVITYERSKYENKKLEAETAKLYSEIATASGEREKKQNKENEELYRRIDALGAELREKEQMISELRRMVKDLTLLIEQKDARIKELERLAKKQEGKIVELEAELAQLRGSK